MPRAHGPHSKVYNVAWTAVRVNLFVDDWKLPVEYVTRVVIRLNCTVVAPPELESPELT